MLCSNCSSLGVIVSQKIAQLFPAIIEINTVLYDSRNMGQTVAATWILRLRNKLKGSGWAETA